MHVSFWIKQIWPNFSNFLALYRKKCAQWCKARQKLVNLSTKKVTATILLQLTPYEIKMSPLVCRLVWFNLGLIGCKLFVWLFFWQIILVILAIAENSRRARAWRAKIYMLWFCKFPKLVNSHQKMCILWKYHP